MRRRITTAKREEIEKEQKILDSTIVRPFETLEGLPISYNPPPSGHYEDVLKNPLTIKDSAVLYNSLIRSRNTYVQHAPMFKLYWVKQTAYAKKLAEMEKDKEATRERETRRRFAKATANSMESKTRTPVLSTDVNARDVMSKLCESSITLGPHAMEIRIFIAKDARSEKSRAFAEISRVSEYTPAPAVTAGTAPAAGPYSGPPHTGPGANGAPVLAPGASGAPGANSGSVAPAPAPVPTPAAATAPVAPAAPAAPAPATSSTPAASTTPVSQKPSAPAPSVQPAVLPAATSKDKNVSSSSATSVKPETEPSSASQATASPDSSTNSAELTLKTAPAPAGGLKSTTSQPPAQTQAAPAPSGSAPPPPPAANLQSVDNLVMISNLNAIAKIDLSLNDLMKVVALGSATEAQITLFKKYIERAKQMGPQPHHADLYYSRNLPLPPNFPRPRPYVERRPPRPKFLNPLKLTAFQEKYLHNATLVFEFLENPNVRYVIPKDSICEVLEAENPPTDAEDDVEFKDILISHVWIHNIDEVEEYEKKLAEYNNEMRKKKEEEEKIKKEQEELEKNGNGGDGSKVPTAVEERNLRTKKRPPPPKKKKGLELPVEPQIRYTTFSFTLHNIPLRFVPIVMNSLKPLDQVQERMAHILKVGTRVTSFYLWYQVDARLDEGVAENLRQAAVQEEKKMQGVLTQGSTVDARKRKPREIKNPKVKRSKDATPSYVPGSLTQPVKQELATT